MQEDEKERKDQGRKAQKVQKAQGCQKNLNKEKAPTPCVINLNGNDWKYKHIVGMYPEFRKYFHPAVDTTTWGSAKVPGSIQSDLLANGEIEDPYKDLNSRSAEWASARRWTYRKSFFLDSKYANNRSILIFEGVDYSASFYLNGEYLGAHTGMFSPVEFDITDLANYGGDNEVAVIIYPAPNEESQLGRTSQVKTAKSRMSYDWDFATRLIPLGIWDDVKVVITGDHRIDDIWARTKLNDHLSSAIIIANTQLFSASEGLLDVEVQLKYNGKVLEKKKYSQYTFGGVSEINFDFQIDNPELWWPNGYGSQPLYTIESKVYNGDSKQLSHKKAVKFGIRKIELVANDGVQDACPYTIKVNNKRMFIKGWNWVPADHLYGTVDKSRYEKFLTLAEKADVNLLRVWGGGLIEKEDFYDFCDENGIMVWQEFIQSSSGIDNMPPTEKQYIQFMAREGEEIVKRKRNHPSLAIWCGGNELKDDKALEAHEYRTGIKFWTKDIEMDLFKTTDETHPLISQLKAVVDRLDPDRPFIPTSPTGPCWRGIIENILKYKGQLHDIHGPWCYMGTTDQYTLYNESDALLHSEFGTSGAASLKSLKKFISPKYMWPPDETNPVWVHHGGDWWLCTKQLKEYFGEINNIEDFVYAMQFIQAEGLRYAVEENRRHKWRCSGTIPWQLNEPWPNAVCTSSVDWYGNPKLAYYWIARAYRPVTISAKYSTVTWKNVDVFKAEVWSNNSTENT